MSQTFSLSKETSLSLKGIFCIGIVLHHLAQRTSIGFLQPLCSAGTFLVAGFFFLSGYGLMAQLQEKGSGYLAGFSRRQIGKVALPYALVTIFYALCFFAAGMGSSPLSILHSLFSGDPFVPFSWYALAIMLFYAAFALCFSRTDSPAAGIFRFLLFLSGYTLLCLALGFGEWWYLSCPGFLLGMLFFGRSRNQVLLFSLAGLPMLCAALWLLRQNAAAALLAKISGICAVTALLFCLFSYFPLNKKALRWLGERSLYFYLLQGLPMALLHSSWLSLRDDYLYAALCILCTLLLTALAQGISCLPGRLAALFTARRRRLPEPPAQN